MVRSHLKSKAMTCRAMAHQKKSSIHLIVYEKKEAVNTVARMKSIYIYIYTRPWRGIRDCLFNLHASNYREPTLTLQQCPFEREKSVKKSAKLVSRFPSVANGRWIIV